MLGVLLLVAVLTIVNLTTSPPTSYDEGVNLQAARNLARWGRYGLVYSEELRPFDLQLTTGPTVIVPVALAFKVFGVGLAQGRGIMAVYTLLAVLGLYRAGGLMYGMTVAGLAVLVRCATELGGPGATRDVVGEVAALAYLFWGLAVFISARGTGRPAYYAGAGLLFGFAILTKGQFGLLLPALIVPWLLTRGQPGGFPARHLVILLTALVAPVTLWQLYQLGSLGIAEYLAHLRDQSAALSVSAYVRPLGRVGDGVVTLQASSMAALSSVGLAYVWLVALRRGWRREAAEHLFLPVFATLWLVWFLGFSAAYARYAIPLLAICSLFLALLARDLAVGFALWKVGGGLVRALLGDPLRSGLLLVLAAAIVSGIGLQLIALTRPPRADAQEITAIISREVEPNASTESFEWQLDVLSERTFHHPPLSVVIRGDSAVPYEVPAWCAYLVDGPMSKAYVLYRDELEQHGYRQIASVGSYDLYHRDPAPSGP